MRPETENFDLDISITDTKARPDTKTEQPKPAEKELPLKSGGAAVAAWMLRNVYLDKKENVSDPVKQGIIDEKRVTFHGVGKLDRQ